MMKSMALRLAMVLFLPHNSVEALLLSPPPPTKNIHPGSSIRHATYRLHAEQGEDEEGQSVNLKPPQTQNPRTRKKSIGFPPSVYNIDHLPKENKASIFDPELMVSDYNRSTRLVQGRSYARNTAFQKENIDALPNIQDLSSPKQSNDLLSDRLWSTTGFRLAVFLAAFFSFPQITQFLKWQNAVPLSQLGQITERFGPGISILYGTLISLTLSILYERQKRISTEVATESSLLVLLTRNMLDIFKDDEESILEMGESVAVQIRILVKESRGTELMTMIYSDPYGRMLDLLYQKRDQYNLRTGDDYNVSCWCNNGSCAVDLR